MMTIQEAISCLEGVLCGAELLETDVDDIIVLLQKQEPVEPTEKDGWHYCGACGRLIDSDFVDEEVFLYCPNCGRKVKRDDQM